MALTFSNTFFSCARVRRVPSGRMKGGSEAPSELSEDPWFSYPEEMSSPEQVFKIIRQIGCEFKCKT